MMKILKTLAIAAVLAAVVTPVMASSALPKNVIGTWCEPTDAGGLTAYLPASGEACKAEQVLTIEPHGYRGFEFTCRVTAMKTTLDPNIIRTWGEPLTQVTADCKGLDDDCWREQLWFSRLKNLLEVELRSSTPKQCKDGR